MKLETGKVILAVLLLGYGCAQQKPSATAPAPQDTLAATAVAQPAGLPAIGKWMLAPDGTPAHWLGVTLNGKKFHEPINVIFVDRAATSPADATNRLLRALTQAGFPLRHGHSSGYSGLIGGVRYDQFPAEKNMAISDEPFEVNNNHGRLFGPCHQSGAYICIAAFSREKVEPLAEVKHAYASFNRARDAVAQRMDQKTTFKHTAFIPLDNFLLGQPDLTTGDHDGLAVLLEARE